MSRLLVIGCGGVAQVAIQKCCQNSGTFTELMIASRTESKCTALKEKLEAAGTPVKLSTARVDADDVEEEVEELRARAAVEVAGRFVGEDEARFVHERACDGDALLFAT